MGHLSVSPTRTSDWVGAETHSLVYFWGGDHESIIIRAPKSRLVVTENFHDELGGTHHTEWDGPPVSESNTRTSDWVGLKHIL
jgi:hypothetical protein